VFAAKSIGLNNVAANATGYAAGVAIGLALTGSGPFATAAPGSGPQRASLQFLRLPTLLILPLYCAQ
jgi:hypothetical protein